MWETWGVELPDRRRGVRNNLIPLKTNHIRVQQQLKIENMRIMESEIGTDVEGHRLLHGSNGGSTQRTVLPNLDGTASHQVGENSGQIEDRLGR